MLTFREYLEKSKLPLRAVAERIQTQLGRPVSAQSVYRWSRPPDHPSFAVPRPDAVSAIFAATGNKVRPESWYVQFAVPPARKRRAA